MTNKDKLKSIYRVFNQKLIIATSIFIVILSFIFYTSTKATILDGIKENLLKDAKLLGKINNDPQFQDSTFNLITLGNVAVEVIHDPSINSQKYINYEDDNNSYVKLLYPFDNKGEVLVLTKNINAYLRMINRVFNNMLLLSFGGLILVIFYALAVSKTLLRPIIDIADKLSNMNENFLSRIDKKSLPIEFHPLANSINTLTNKIENFVKFKKELFIGAAHELKTPLAVMKLKSEVTLMKKRECDKYEETLKLTISQINDMNKMISSILDVGRAEGAQFEKPVELEIVEFLRNKVEDYKLLSEEKKINLIFKTDIEEYTTTIQPTLLIHIIQNFVQNAIKFTPSGSEVYVNIQKIQELLVIEVIDEGVGIDESIDLFAPFKRVGTQSGAGLGLFLAKNAADSLGATISLKNRPSSEGTIATLILSSNPSCKI